MLLILFKLKLYYFPITLVEVEGHQLCFAMLQIEIQNKFASGNMPVILSVHPDTVACHKSDQLVNGKFTPSS